MLTIVVESLSGAPNNAITFYSINISWVRRLFSLLNPVHCALKGSQLSFDFFMNTINSGELGRFLYI